MGPGWWWLAWGLVIATGLDVAYRYSPNRLHGLLAAGGLIYQLQSIHGMQLFWQGMLVLAMVCLALLAFALGWLRGGDAKALMAMSCWLPTAACLPWLLTIALMAGLLSMGLLLHETWLQGWPWLLGWLQQAALGKPDIQRLPQRLQVPLVYPIATATWLHMAWPHV